MHIHYFAMAGKIDELKQYLHDNPSSLNAKSKESESSLLIVAVYSAQLEIAKFLLSFPNIDIYAKDQNGRNVLHFLLLGISDARVEERGAYYDIAEKILQLDAQYRAHHPMETPLLQARDKCGGTALIIVISPKNDDIRRTILSIAKKVEETELKTKATEEEEREDRKETARLQLYSEKSPSILRERNKEEKLSHWSFSSLLSMCGIWGKKHDRRSTLSELQESEPEREKLLEKKTV